MEAQVVQETGKVRGFFRVQIDEGGKIVGDSGWRENQVTNLGFQQYLCFALAASAGSKQISHMALGTGSAPNASHTTLHGELGAVRASVTPVSSTSSKTIRFTATFASGVEITAAAHIANVGLFNSESGGTLFSGNTYTSSAVATNQNVNATYDIVFS